MPPPHDVRFPYRSELELPVIGLESEFQIVLDGTDVAPEDIWRTPASFMDRPLLKRTNKSLQLPTGGALYFDGGVLEVVTPVIEIAPQCTGRVVRSLWEQIAFVRDQLDAWERREGKRVALRAFSCHTNISFELSSEERNRDRTIQKLAMLLAHLLPVPVIVAGANRRSTGIGVRPRRERIEITGDFTPDPGLMAAATALIVGIVRDVISWPSYRVETLAERGIPALTGVTPGRHATRNGWLAKDFHFPRSPFTGSLDEQSWEVTTGGTMSLRQVAATTAAYFRDSIRTLSDPFSFRLLQSVLRGETPSLLDLPDRPAAYDDVGRLVRWGSVIPELNNYESLMHDETGGDDEARRRRQDLEEKLAPPWSGDGGNRRAAPARSPRAKPNQRKGERRSTPLAPPSSRLTRSAYEKVFLALTSGRRLRVGDELLTPVKVKGWYHSVFQTPSGEERLISIDQLLDYMGSWS